MNHRPVPGGSKETSRYVMLEITLRIKYALFQYWGTIKTIGMYDSCHFTVNETRSLQLNGYVGVTRLDEGKCRGVKHGGPRSKSMALPMLLLGNVCLSLHTSDSFVFKDVIDSFKYSHFKKMV